jgi:hypothetical protein
LTTALRGHVSLGRRRRPGRGWRPTGRVVQVAAVLVTAAVVALPSTPALAADIHKPLFHISEIPAQGLHGEPVAAPGPLGEEEASMAVAAGHVWVAGKHPEGGSAPFRVDEFDAATGGFISQFAHSSHPPELPTVESPRYEGVAVGAPPGEVEPQVYLVENSIAKRETTTEAVGQLGVYGELGAKRGSWSGAGTPEKSFGPYIEKGITNSLITAVAVDSTKSLSDWAVGDVFVAASHVVDVFHPQAGATGEEKYVTQLTGVSPTEKFAIIQGVTVNDLNGDLIVSEGGRLDLFEPTSFEHYAFVRTLTLPSSTIKFEASRVDANDGEGDIYATGSVVEDGIYRGEQVFEFNAVGEFKGRVPVPLSESGLSSTTSVAGDPETHGVFVGVKESPQVGARDPAAGVYAFGPNIVVPDVTTGAVSNLKAASVTLNGTVNPDGAGAAKCQFVWGRTTFYGQVASCPEVPEGNTPVLVQVSLGGLEPDTTYHYRLQASNANGTNAGELWQDQQFTTPGPGMHGEGVVDVAGTSATFKTTIDPNNGPTSYYFQYGTSSEYTQQAPAPPGQAIGSGSTDVVSSVHVQGLSPSTGYHYRVVVVSEVAPGVVETVDGADHTFTTQAAGGGFSLTDGRQWELVSPASKLGALIEPPDLGSGVIQAAANGAAIAYRTSSPTEAEPSGGFAANVTVLSTRDRGDWSSQDISPPNIQASHATIAVGHEYQIFSEDLSLAAMQPETSVFTPLSPEASESTPYLRTDYTGGNVEDHCRASCYRPLVTGRPGFANVPPGTVFGEEPDGTCRLNTCGPAFQGASPDLSHVVLSSPAQLTSTLAPAGAPGLYEWFAGALQLLDVLPKGEEGPAVLAGTGTSGTFFEPNPQLGVRHSVSNNGERVVLEGGATGGKGLYLRDIVAGHTVRLDVPQGGSGASENVSYMDANSDASRVFFLDSGHLMAGASPSGADLYEYNLSATAGSRLRDLTVNPNAGQAAHVKMMIGASEGGSYVYFAAGGALAPGAVEGECPKNPDDIHKAEEQRAREHKEPSKGCNLYVLHEGVTRLVAVLPGEDFYDWSKELGYSRPGLRARVSPKGRWFAFLSEAELTGYDTHDALSGHPDIEVYLYDAASGKLVCPSCNPTGARPVGRVEPKASDLEGLWVAASVPSWTMGPRGEVSFAAHQPRYLSDSGRLFFDSTDALVAQDVNGVRDVYEFEPVGVRGCSSVSATFAARSGGCVNLVSSGSSPTDSAFLEASETGADVFFRTQAQLVQQDYDTAYDVYDAHECTSAAPCLPVVTTPPPCSTEASCKAAPTPQPAFYGAPASATFSGTGNLLGGPQPPPVKKTAVQVRAEKLTKALKACKKDKNKRRRSTCEKTAHKKYGATPRARRATHNRRASR